MKTKRKRGKKPVAASIVRRLACALPGVQEGTCFGTPAWRVAGKFLARLREDGESLVVKVGYDERDILLAAAPKTFYTTDHYRGYPTVLVRLSVVRPETLRQLLEQAWRRVAPKRLLASHGGDV